MPCVEQLCGCRPQVKEVALMHSEGILAGEMKHGPLALVDEHLPIIVICTRDRMYHKMLSVVQQLLARCAAAVAACICNCTTLSACVQSRLLRCGVDHRPHAHLHVCMALSLTPELLGLSLCERMQVGGPEIMWGCIKCRGAQMIVVCNAGDTEVEEICASRCRLIKACPLERRI